MNIGDYALLPNVGQGGGFSPFRHQKRAKNGTVDRANAFQNLDLGTRRFPGKPGIGHLEAQVIT
jgi:hypothetical protein